MIRVGSEKMEKQPRDADGLTEDEFLANYHMANYDLPSVAVDMIILAMNQSYSKLKILLIKRKEHPFIEQWALPGGFVKANESTYEAAGRHLREETGLTDVYMEQIYTMSRPDRDPRMRVISIDYLALINEQEVTAGEKESEALWFDITFQTKESSKYLELRNEETNTTIKYLLKKKDFRNGVVKVEGYVPELSDTSDDALAFDHAESILEGLIRIKNKVMYSDIAFNLVPKEFTLPDLQAVYEIILGRELYKTNFKAGIIKKIEPLERKGTSVTGGKKSMLYHYIERR